MALFKKIIAAATFVALSITAIVPTALAQGTMIIVIDQARIMRDSAGGQDIARKLAAIGQTMQSELEGEAGALQTEGQALETRRANLTPEALQADTELQSQFQSFLAKRQAFQRKQQVRAQELQQTEQTAWAEFFQALEPVLEQVVTERGAQLMIDRSSITFAAPELDATDLAITKIDALKPTVNVTRARLPAQPAAAQ
ncbi:MAG: OmpH family outer membrane protein [Pseudomonadota bacterium]